MQFKSFLIVASLVLASATGHAVSEAPHANAPAIFAASLRTVVADDSPYRTSDYRARILSRLIADARNVDEWPSAWRETHGPELRDLLDRLLRRYKVRHAQIERLADLFDLLDLWSGRQNDWLRDTYLNKSWPRLVVPLLRTLASGTVRIRRDFVVTVDGRHSMKTTFVTHAILNRLDPPKSTDAVFRFLTAFPADATEQTVASSRQGYRVVRAHELHDFDYAEAYREEVNALLGETFEAIRTRYRRRGRDNEVVAAVAKARATRAGSTGRKTAEQSAVLDELLARFDGREDFLDLFDVGVRFAPCARPLTAATAAHMPLKR